MVRACIVPNNEFVNIGNDTIKAISNNMYDLYEKLFGKTNCTYSIHVVCSHLLQIRGETSAFKFESFYGELRRSFVSGTPSTLKQMLQTVYLRRFFQGEKPYTHEEKNILHMQAVVFSRRACIYGRSSFGGR